MKKFIFSLVLALIMLGFSAKVYSTCPDGYTETSKTFTIGTCVYNVTICYMCAVGPQPLTYLQINEFYKLVRNCNQTLSTQQVLDALNNELMNLITELCGPLIPPCNGINYKRFVQKDSKCWYKTNDRGDIHYKICNDCYCCIPYKYCWDTQNERTIITQDGNPYWDCTTDCTDSEPSDPYWGQSTGCFYLGTPCN